MRISKLAALTAPLAVASLALTACGSGSSSTALSNADGSKQGVNQINPVDRSKLKQGGDFRWAVDNLASNWNYNELDGTDSNGKYMIDAVMPEIMTGKADGTVDINPDYLTSASIVSSSPEIIEYKINPKATWSNGRKFTWEDFQAQWQANNGTNAAYLTSGTTGYEDVASVEKGIDDQDVKVTFKADKKYAEWKSLFGPLYPKELNSSVTEFNTGWADAPKITAGPFKIGKIDTTAQTATVVPDASWWGTKPLLGSITFITLARATLADSFANNTIDYFDLGALTDQYAKVVQQGDKVKINAAPMGDWYHLDFSGKAGSITSDPAIRVALSQAVNRTAVTQATLGQMVKNPTLLNNHVLADGSAYYKANNGSVDFNVDAANKGLEAAGWKLNGTYRVKDGKQLDLHFIIPTPNPVSPKIAAQVQNMMKAVGANVIIDSVPTADFFKKYVNVGDYDLTLFRWIATPYPVSSNSNIYSTDAGQNFGKVETPGVKELFAKAQAELDDTKRAAILNQIDAELWKIGFSLPIVSLPGASATRSTLGNWGAWGYADKNYVNIGFLK